MYDYALTGSWARAKSRLGSWTELPFTHPETLNLRVRRRSTMARRQDAAAKLQLTH